MIDRKIYKELTIINMDFWREVSFEALEAIFKKGIDELEVPDDVIANYTDSEIRQWAHDKLEDFISNHLDNHIVVDEKISDLIIKLNKSGYKTVFCCQGHVGVCDNETYVDSEPYVMFKTDNVNKVIDYMLNKDNGMIEYKFERSEISPDTYLVTLYMADKIYIKFLDEHNDRYENSIEEWFDEWLNTDLKNLVNNICE